MRTLFNFTKQNNTPRKPLSCDPRLLLARKLFPDLIDFELWKGVLGRQGIDNCNDKGLSLLEFSSEHQLVITNTLFQQKDRFKATWRHPRSKHWYPLDNGLARQRDERDIPHTRVMPSADCCTDHRLVRCKVAFTFKPPPMKKGPQTQKAASAQPS